MTGVQNIINHLKSGETIELSSQNEGNQCLQYSIEENTFVIFNAQYRSLLTEEKEIELILRSHFEGKDVMQE